LFGCFYPNLSIQSRILGKILFKVGHISYFEQPEWIGVGIAAI